MICRFTLASLAVGALFAAAPVWATVTLDRNYQLGDDGAEGAVIDGEVGANFTGDGGTRFTADSEGISTGPNFEDLQDLTVLGTPLYRDVSSRPIISSGIGVEFDGTDDVLHGVPLNIPEEFAGSVTNFPHIYAGLSSRGLQMWVRPDSSALGTELAPTSRQGIVMDSVAMGGVSITADGKWTQVNDGHVDDVSPEATVSVIGDTWQHVMHHVHVSGIEGAPRVTAGADLGFTGVVYVNGIAVSANNDTPEIGDLTAGGRIGRLAVGAEEIASVNETDPEFTNFFKGQIDNLEMYVFEDNSGVVGGQNYGPFDLFADNEWIANEIAQSPLNGTLQIGDVNKDGLVNGDGSGSAATDDVTAFIDGWLSENRLVGAHNTITVGDWGTWSDGDMNLDGRTDLRDWALINNANPAIGAAIDLALNGTSVPEPSTIMLIGLFNLMLASSLRRR